MDPNPVLKKLGFSNDDRVVIIHTDDIGMCHASVAAFAELWEYGIISSGATMVPCPWFLEAAAFARLNPTVDLGIHVTLTSEWDSYRWGPISSRDPETGMIDSQGYFYRTSEEAQKHGNPKAVREEIRVQIERAISCGIPVSHIDTHMGTVASRKFIPAYIQLALQYKLPFMMMRLAKQDWLEMGLDENTADFAVAMVIQLEEQGIPLLDRISSLPLDQAKTKDERIIFAKHVLDKLEPGITHFIIHPSVDTPELRAITSDWQCRIADFEAFRSEEIRNYIANQGIHVIGYQLLKNLMS